MNFELYEDYATFIIESETHGTFRVQIDLDDVNKCREYKWAIGKSVSNQGKYVKYYVVSGSEGLLLHRFLMNPDKDMVVDHIDGDTMNNRKSNLRVCETKENLRNSKHRINNTSGYKGVTWFKPTRQWMAYIMVDYKHKTLGYFDDIEDAVEARKVAEDKYFGEYSYEEKSR